jgi:hypothetical protein
MDAELVLIESNMTEVVMSLPDGSRLSFEASELWAALAVPGERSAA